MEILGTHNSSSVCSIEDGATWRVTELESGEVFESDQSIDIINEQLLPAFGISINLEQVENAGDQGDNNGAVGSTIDYTALDQPIEWFSAVRDNLSNIGTGQGINGPLRSVFDFILTDGPDPDQAAFNTDPTSRFASLGTGLWYPYLLTSVVPKSTGIPYITPGWTENGNHNSTRPPGGNIIRFLNNVDIVMTSDKSQWSRCLVLETGRQGAPYNTALPNLDLRVDSPSVNKDGLAGVGSDPTDENSSNFIENFAERSDDLPSDLGETGYSWFPGYAIDVETGQRLNIFFGENSAFNEEYSMLASQIGFDSTTMTPILDEEPDRFNVGDDMLYNPTDELFAFNAGGAGFDPLSIAFAGGQHYIYVTRDEYDGCADYGFLFRDELIPFFAKQKLLPTITWCSMSMMEEGVDILGYDEGVVPSDVTFRLRVDKPYNLQTQLDLDFPDGTRCLVEEGDAGGFPLYQFRIDGAAPTALEQDDYEGALANINVVPNPYYAFSAYEIDQFERVVRITNVPDRAVVTIFSLDGKFIQQFNRAETPQRRSGSNPGTIFSQTTPFIEWNLENSAGIPIASGIYLIHIAAPREDGSGIDERTIKFFGVNRQFDPSGL